MHVNVKALHAGSLRAVRAFLRDLGRATFTGVTALNDGTTPRTVKVTAGDVEFDAVVRIDTPGEADYYRNGGILQYVLRSLL